MLEMFVTMKKDYIERQVKGNVQLSAGGTIDFAFARGARWKRTFTEERGCRHSSSHTHAFSPPLGTSGKNRRTPTEELEGDETPCKYGGDIVRGWDKTEKERGREKEENADTGRIRCSSSPSTSI